MAIPVLVLGRSGSGKTYSLKNFKPSEVGILSVEKGRLPFKSELKVVKVKSYNDGEHTPAQANAARYEKGYDKFVGIAANFRGLIHSINEMEEEDKIVYFLHHSELDADGREKVKTIGKMLDEKLCIEGCFDIVLFCQDQKFFTQSNGQSVAKSPEGMFELEIPNDLKAVDDAIRDYYGLKTETKKDNKK